MPSDKVRAVFDALIADETLPIDFWAVIEKAVRKADVGDFSPDECSELIQYMADMTGSLIETRPEGIHK